MDIFLIYSEASDETGPRLGDYLGVESGREMPDRRYDYLIRWGSTQRVSYIPSEETLNLRRAVSNNVDKYQSLRMLDQASVPTPPFSKNPEELDFPLLGRNTNHREGSDIELIMQPKDLELTESSFFLEYVPKETEYRVHVAFGNIIKVSQKKLEEPSEYDPICWNYEKGFVFKNPDSTPRSLQQAKAAVGALELDFGAVDMVVGPEGTPYVFEVNTAPGLAHNSLETWGEAFVNKLGLEDYPGLEAVEWDDEEVDETN